MKLDEKIAKRFWAKVRMGAADDCWPWQGEIKWPARAVKGSINSECYGAFYIQEAPKTKPKRHSAHRVAWSLEYGQILEGECVCHSCDNPRCCNPRHLWLGTVQQNVADRHAKGRSRGGTTGNKKRSDASWADTAAWQLREARRLQAKRGVRGRYASDDNG